MSADFFKLYKTFWTGTIREERATVRLLFLAMISLCDENGIVRATPQFIANFSNLTSQATSEALNILMKPDLESTSPDEDGRRIVLDSPNVYRVVNYRRYYDKSRESDRRDYQREYKRRQRENGKSDSKTTVSTDVNNVHPERKGKRKERNLATDSEGFWAQFRKNYPRRKGDLGISRAKAAFEKLCKSEDPQLIVEGAARYREYCESEGKVGTSFVKQMSTFLNSRAWEEYLDGAGESPESAVGGSPAESVGKQAVATLLRMTGGGSHGT